MDKANSNLHVNKYGVNAEHQRVANIELAEDVENTVTINGNVFTKGEVETNKEVTYDSNGEKTLSPTEGKTSMAQATITVNVPQFPGTLTGAITYTEAGEYEMSLFSDGVDTEKKVTVTISE